MRNRVDVAAGLFFGLLGLGVTLGAIQLRVGTATEPQAGFFPFIGGIALIVLSSVLLVQGWRGRTAVTKFGELRRPGILVLSLVTYVAVVKVLGFILATALLGGLILWILDTKPWWVLVGVSLFLAFGTYYLFDRLLEMPLPAGIIEGIL